MSITYGDNLKHNNPLFPIVDVEDVKGGIRTIATFSNTDLYNAFNDIPDKLKQNYTSLIVTSTSQHYYLTGTDATITTSWTLTGSGFSGTGTTNSIAKWTGSTSLGDSLISDNGDTITINGNLNVIGTSSTVTSQNLLIKDPIILLAGSQSTPLFDSGLFVNRGTSDTQAFIWDESASEFSFFSTTSSSTTLGNVSIGTYSNVKTGSLYSIGDFRVDNKPNNSYLDIEYHAQKSGDDGIIYTNWFVPSFDNRMYQYYNQHGVGERMDIFYHPSTGYNNKNGSSTYLMYFETGYDDATKQKTTFQLNGIDKLVLMENGNVVLGSDNYINNAYPSVLRSSNALFTDTNAPGKDISIQSGSGRGTGVGGTIKFETATSGISGSTLNTPITRMVVTTEGYVGIGLTAPSTKLHIFATQSGAFRLQDGTQQDNYVLKSDSNGVASWVSLSTIGISGASGSIPKFTGTSSLGDSRFFDDGTSGSYGSGTSRVYFLPGGNTWLTLNRSQAAMNFILGNPQISQTCQVKSDNYLGLSIESAGYTQFKVSASYSTSLVISSNGSVYNDARGSNTLYGLDALLVSTGANNVAIGARSLQNNTTGYNNTALGYQSLFNNTIGNTNVAIGYQALVFNTTGNINIAVGNSSLSSNKTGNQNISIGSNTLYFNTTGSYNTAIGNGSLNANTISSYNTALGNGSLQNNTTSISSLGSIIDGGSGYTASSTFSNVQLSYISGSTAIIYPIVTIYVGAGGTVSTVTLVTNGTGFKDTTTVMGANLGTGFTFSIGISGLSSADSNTALGYNSMYSNISGFQNTAIGHQSLYNNTTRFYNTAIGYQSLYSNNGAHNTGVGHSSMYSNSTGQYNTAIGSGALFSNSIGGNNTVIGANALVYNTTGQDNTVIGANALGFNTGSYNIAIGSNAGFGVFSSAATYSTNSIFIGYDTKPKLDSQTNQIVIGHGATGSGSNSVTLGADTITKTQLRGTINIGNVPQYASNGAAISGGLVPGDIYQTLSNVLMVVI